MDTATQIPQPNAEVFKPVITPTVNGKAFRDANGTWYNALGLESTESLRHVARKWQEECINFPEFVQQVLHDSEFKSDEDIEAGDFRLDEELHAPNGLGFTDYGLLSLTNKYTTIPASMVDYLRVKGETKDLARHINSELEERLKESKREYSFKLRKRMDMRSGEEVIRMVASGRYGVADNASLVEAIHDSLDPTKVDQALASHLYDNGDDMSGNILLPDNMKKYPDSDYGIGIAFKNSEVGKYRYSVRPFIFRGICLNGCIWDKVNSEVYVNQKHLGKVNIDDLTEKVPLVIKMALSEGHDFLNALGFTRDARIPIEYIPNVVAYLTREYKLNIEQGRRWLDFFDVEPTENGFGIINALTRAAQTYSSDVRYSMETVAGKLVATSLDVDKDHTIKRWDRILANGKAMDDKVVELYVA